MRSLGETFRKGLLSSAILSALLGAAAAYADDATFNLDIPAESLGQALRDFSRSSNQQIIFSEDLVRDHTSTPLKGAFTSDQALDILLHGTGLEADRSGAGVLMIHARPRQAAAAAPLDPPPSPAASPAASTAEDTQEIIVTAQRREEKLRDVPIAVTAITETQLEARNITDLRSIAALAPNLNTVKFPLDNTALGISIRGISTGTQTIVQDAGVGIYVDGLYIARPSGSNYSLFDVQRVEVLRGPQGTLFGRNTIGGALNITTNSPTDNFGGWVEAGGGNYDQWNVNGVLNVPIVSDRLDARLVYAHQEHRGYVRDAFLGTFQNPDDADYIRLSLKATLSDDWNLLVSADHLRDDVGAQASKLIYVTPGSPTAKYILKQGANPLTYEGNLYTTYADFNPQNGLNTNDVTATLTGDLGFGTFKDIFGYRHLNVARAEDTDGTPFPIIHNVFAPSYSDFYSNETQLYGKSFDNRLDWIGGLYYSHEIGGDGIDSHVFIPNPSPSALTLNSQVGRNLSYAVFGQATYAVLPNLKIDAGLRYSYDERYVQWTATSNATAVPCAPAVASIIPLPSCMSGWHGVDYHYFPLTAKLEYEPTDLINTYLSYSEGFRSGGFPQAGGAQLAAYQPFGPEHAMTTEAGLKADWLEGRRFSTNLAVFHTHYSDLQTSHIAFTSLGQPFQLISNIGTGRMWGVEAEANAAIEDLRLSASFGWTDAQYVDGPYTGRPFVLVPNKTASIAADYPFDFQLGVLMLHMDYDWRSRMQFQYNSAPGTIGWNLDGQNAFGLLNGRISFDFEDLPITLSLWGKNLAGQHYVLWVSDQSASLGGVYAVPGDPMTFGATVRYRFGE